MAALRQDQEPALLRPALRARAGLVSRALPGHDPRTAEGRGRGGSLLPRAPARACPRRRDRTRGAPDRAAARPRRPGGLAPLGSDACGHRDARAWTTRSPPSPNASPARTRACCGATSQPARPTSTSRTSRAGCTPTSCARGCSTFPGRRSWCCGARTCSSGPSRCSTACSSSSALAPFQPEAFGKHHARADRPALDAAIRERLAPRFAAANADLAALLGTPLWWDVSGACPLDGPGAASPLGSRASPAQPVSKTPASGAAPAKPSVMPATGTPASIAGDPAARW